MKYCYTIILFLLLNTISLFSQISNEYVFRSALILQFIEMTTWPEEHSEINLAFYSNNLELYQSLNKTINDYERAYSINLKKIYKPSEIEGFQVVYLDENKSDKINEVWHNIKGSNCLLITTEHNETKDVMINFTPMRDGKIGFEVNKANIISQNLKVHQDIFLYGGKTTDVVRLYKESQKELVSYKDTIDIQKAKLDSVQKNLDYLMSQIQEQKKKLRIQEDKLVSQKAEMNLLNNEIITKKENIIKIEDLFEVQKASMLVKEKEIKTKQASVDSFNILIDNQLRIINHHKKEINNQKFTLKEQESTLKSRTIILFFAIGSLFIFIIMLFLILKSFRNNRIANKELQDKNQKISAQKEELANTLHKMKEMQGQIVNSEKMASLGVLTAGIAHEINNPINFISSGIEALNLNFEDLTSLLKLFNSITNENVSEKLNEINEMKQEIEYDVLISELSNLIKNVSNGVDRTTQIIQGLRTFSRLDDESIKKVDVHVNIDSTLTLLNNRLKDRIDVIKNYGDIPLLQCYPGKMNQVYMNILVNAIDAIEDKGTITITTSYENKQISIKISDDGNGIEKKDIPSITDPFFTTKDVGKGTGLGLSITYGIIQDHNGELNFESIKGKGTEVQIILPIEQKK